MACDQIVFSTPKRTVNEQSTMLIFTKYRDRSTAALVVPTTVAYRVDDLSTGIKLVDFTNVTPATGIFITITSAANKIQNDFLGYETKQLTVKTDAGLSTQFIETFTWDVKNIQGLN